MKPYPAYKSSGVTWLGEMPAHWEAKRVKHITRHTTGWTPPTGERAGYEGSNLWATIADLGEHVITDTKNRISDEAVVQASIVASPVGSLLFSFKLSVGQVSVVGVPLYTNEAIATFLPADDFYIGWAFYAFPAFIPENSATNIYGAKLLNQQRINDASLVFPPIDEQQGIANYLDTETARIDTLIAEKGRLIETLREYRQATICEVVTQGLDTAAPKKPSGVPWLGDVPAHWEIKSLRRVTDGLAMNGIFKKNDEFGEGAPLVNVTDLFSDNFFVDGSSLERVRCSELELNQYQVCDGDLFLVRSSLKLDGIAMFAVARNIIEPTVFECHVVRLRPDSSLCNSRFMAFFLNSSYGRQSLISRSKSTTMTTIDQGEVLSTYIVSPPLDEQEAIALYLDREVASIDKLLAHVQDEIKLLQELRAATITDAVTGKVQVS